MGNRINVYSRSVCVCMDVIWTNGICVSACSISDDGIDILE